jgi:hypothetical protein
MIENIAKIVYLSYIELKYKSSAETSNRIFVLSDFIEING